MKVHWSRYRVESPHTTVDISTTVLMEIFYVNILRFSCTSPKSSMLVYRKIRHRITASSTLVALRKNVIEKKKKK